MGQQRLVSMCACPPPWWSQGWAANLHGCQQRNVTSSRGLAGCGAAPAWRSRCAPAWWPRAARGAASARQHLCTRKHASSAGQDRAGSAAAGSRVQAGPDIRWQHAAGRAVACTEDAGQEQSCPTTWMRRKTRLTTMFRVAVLMRLRCCWPASCAALSSPLKRSPTSTAGSCRWPAALALLKAAQPWGTEVQRAKTNLKARLDATLRQVPAGPFLPCPLGSSRAVAAAAAAEGRVPCPGQSGVPFLALVKTTEAQETGCSCARTSASKDSIVLLCLSGTASHLLTQMTQARPSAATISASLKSCRRCGLNQAGASPARQATGLPSMQSRLPTGQIRPAMTQCSLSGPDCEPCCSNSCTPAQGRQTAAPWRRLQRR